MVEDKPFIHLMETSCGYYIFDVNKNVIKEISKDVYDVLEYEQMNGEETYECDQRTKSSIDLLKKEGFLSSFRVSEIENPLNPLIETYLSNYVEKLTLQVTQQCNLRCRYCPYSGFGESWNRDHQNRVMSFETAKKSIDFYISHCKNVPFIAVSFYGGEPLLEFELIKKCVAYVKERAVGKRTVFSMTTNATLLDDEKMGFLEENRFSVLVSLDGPREVHNKNRRFAGDGSGSFDSVVENMKVFSKRYPEYFKKLVRFNAVIDPQNNLSCTNDFFMNFDILFSENIRASYVDNRFSKEKDFVSEEFSFEYNYDMFKVYLYLVGRLDKKYISPIILNQYESSVKLLKAYTPTTRLPEKMHHSGPCVAGSSKLFVDVDGRLLPCERVNEQSEAMIIGNIDTGFDIEKIHAIMNVGKLTEDDCKNCWAIRYCTLCASFAEEMNELSGEKKKIYCDGVRKSTDTILKNHIALKHYGLKGDAV